MPAISLNDRVSRQKRATVSRFKSALPKASDALILAIRFFDCRFGLHEIIAVMSALSAGLRSP